MIFVTVFADMWHALMADVMTVCKDVIESTRQPEKQTYMSLPRPGVSLFSKKTISLYIEMS